MTNSASWRHIVKKLIYFEEFFTGASVAIREDSSQPPGGRTWSCTKFFVIVAYSLAKLKLYEYREKIFSDISFGMNQVCMHQEHS